MDFVHLHNHSEYSILDGAIRIQQLIQFAVNNAMPAIALTDHGNMFGTIEFYEEAHKAGIKPIIGQEFYIAPGSRFYKQSTRGSNDENAYHLILLAQNYEGYKNLVKLSSLGYLEGFYYKPRIDWELLTQYSTGLIASTACIAGEIPSLILDGKVSHAYKRASEFADLFGKDKFFLELQDHNLKEQKKVNEELIKMAAQLNVGLIATNDAHYLNKDDAYYHDVLLCIQTGKSLNDQKRMRFPNAEFYLKTPGQMETIFEDYPDALYNTVKIAEMIDCQIPLGNAILPNFEVPEGYTKDSYLTELVNTGAQKRFGAIVPDYVKNRIEYELSVIQRMQFSGYFLVVWDFIQFAKQHGIPVGPGRGSAAGSMVSYCLEITELDPMKYNLLFERFLNPERNEMPDMDIDFCALRRDEVIDYVKQKYGEDHVSQIITFNKMKSKGAIRDVARALEIPLQQVNALTKLIRHEDLEEALQASDELKQLYKTNDTGKQLITIAKKVEGLTRSAGKHAAGVVISREPLMEHVPLYRDPKDGSISSQYEKVSLEKAGLVKMDFLGLANLTIIDTCIKLIKKHKNIAIDIAAIPLDDAKTYKLLQKADTMGVFQLESSGMQNILLKLGPTNFDDIIAIVALYRPGPLDSGMVEEFIERKRNPQKVEYLHPSLEPILKDTMGVIVYQEQVMLISQVMGGFTLPDADKLRKAMSKKKMDIIDAMEDKFVQGAKQKKIDESVARTMYDLMRTFGRYGFNKSHSAAYALVSYQTAYLKAHYPLEFMTALLTAQVDNIDNIAKYYTDCKAKGIAVLPPDINHSYRDFSIEGKAIRYGLISIKGVGDKAIESIIEAREKVDSFHDLTQFFTHIDLMTVNKGVIESLIKAGAFDPVYPNRGELFASVDVMLEKARNMQQDISTGQGDLFGASDKQFSRINIEPAPTADWTENVKLQYEKEVLGIYVSAHPLSRYAKDIEKFACTPIKDLENNVNGSPITLVGILNNVQIKQSQKGNKFAQAAIEDLTGSLQVLLMPQTLSEYETLITSQEPVVITGTVEIENEKPSRMIAQKIFQFTQFQLTQISELHIIINPIGTNTELLEKIKKLLQRFQGNKPVYFHVRLPNGNENIIKANPLYHIKPDKKLMDGLTAIVGKDGITYSIGC